ncbi:putative membrane protein, partial [Escherichia coli 89.0511]
VSYFFKVQNLSIFLILFIIIW